MRKKSDDETTEQMHRNDDWMIGVTDWIFRPEWGGKEDERAYAYLSELPPNEAEGLTPP